MNPVYYIIFLLLFLIILLAFVGEYLGFLWSKLRRENTELKSRLKEKDIQACRYRGLFGGVGQGVLLLNREGMIIEANDLVSAYLPNDSKVPVRIFDFIAGQDRQRVESALDQAWQGQLQQVDAVYWSQDDERHEVVDFIFSPVLQDGNVVEVFVLLTISTPLMRSIELQAESMDRLQSLLMAIPDVLFTTDVEGRIEYWNESAEELTGYPAWEMNGRPWQAVLKMRKEVAGKSMLSEPQVDLPQMMNEECQIITRDGMTLTVLVSSGALFDSNGSTSGSLTVLKDITPMKALEERLRQQQGELQAANRHLEELAHHRSRFLSQVSHELRTPLNSIIGFTGILLEEIVGPLNEEQHKQLSMVYRQSQRLLDQINELLDAARLESRSVTLDRRPFAVEGAIITVVDALQVLAQAKKLELAFRQSDVMLPLVYADPKRVEQILNNLISNSIKYTQSGAIEVECRICEDLSNYVEVRVRDTGVGIDPREHSRIFEEFWQLERSEMKGVGGAGLGLAIAKRLVELQGGVIGLDSEPGRGTTFYFTLPIHEPSSLEPRLPGRTYLGQPAAIIAEDPTLARGLKHFLQDRGVQVAWWSQQEEFEQELKGLAESDAAPEVLIVDEACWESVQSILQESPFQKQQPACLVLSLDKEGEDVDNSRLVFCRKPISRERLIHLLNQFLTMDGTSSMADRTSLTHHSPEAEA